MADALVPAGSLGDGPLSPADALYIAHVLGRTLVEPRVAHARMASLANGSGRTRGGGGARLALHHYFDLQPLCARFALLPARDFERRTHCAARSMRAAQLVAAAVWRAALLLLRPLWQLCLVPDGDATRSARAT